MVACPLPAACGDGASESANEVNDRSRLSKRTIPLASRFFFGRDEHSAKSRKFFDGQFISLPKELS